MNQKIKISQLPAKGSNLAAQDLIEIAEFTGTGYISKSITGQEIIDAAVGNVDWGDIGGTLSNQTDLQNALDAKVPTTRTLTINGVTQDLSTNRTFTISTGITIGSTAIASGVVGRVLFEGAGNVVQQSSSLFWDNTNARLGIGTSTPTQPIDVNGNGRIQGQLTTGGGSPLVLTGESFAFQTVVASGPGGSVFGTNAVSPSFIDILSGNNFWHISNRSSSGSNRIGFFNANFTGTTASYSNELFTIHTSGNIGIGTTTDAGFRLDVNGTARVQGNAQFGTGFYWDNTNNRLGIGTSSPLGGIHLQQNLNYPTLIVGRTATRYAQLTWDDPLGEGLFQTFNRAFPFVFDASLIRFMSNGLERMRIFNSGNVGINTTTDAGFRLDVNGDARVVGNMQAAKNQNGSTQLIVSNTNNNAASYVSLKLTSSGGSAEIGRFSASSTTSKIIQANDTFIYNPTSNGNISILNDFATGQIRMAAGGSSTAQMTLKASGVLNLSSVPTSPAGLSTGDVWNNLGVLMIV